MRTIVILIVLFALAGLTTAAPAHAAESDTTPLAALERLFVSDAIEAAWFSPSFLQQVPVQQIEAVIAQLSSGLGDYLGVSHSGQEYLVEFENGDLPAIIALDEAGRISTLFLQAPRLRVAGIAEAVAAFETLPGEVSLAVYSHLGEVAAIDAAKPLAVGSSFKLAVLAALEQQIQSGARNWSDVVTLEEGWRSLPTGVLQVWPVGSPVTLHTLATQMISISDNTATDALIHILGRELIERYTPRNSPLLTTRDAFVLKSAGNADLLDQYRAADVPARRTLLAELEKAPLPSVEALSLTKPTALDVEWHLTTQELCGLMSIVHHLDLMSVNPGIARPGDWAKVSYKGGSEPGVLNYTTWLDLVDGGFYCVSATWNNEQETLDELSFYSKYVTLIEELKKL